VAKKWQQKSLAVKVLFTIRQLQLEYEMQRQRGSGSFFAEHSHAHLCSHAFYGASFDAWRLYKENP